MQPTIVTYPGGSISELARVTNLYDGENGVQVVVTDVTPFHPLDPWWPDQPSDRGIINVIGQAWVIDGAVLVGTKQDRSEIRIGDPKGVKRSDPSWSWSVGHVVFGSPTGKELINAKCRLEVDPEYRRAIAVGHTACHIAALALNERLETYWTKSIVKDSFGRNDFDRAAIVFSRIEEFGSIDRYRIGKGVRKAGFSSDRFWSDCDTLASEIEVGSNQILNEIASIDVAPDHTPFHARRNWVAVHKNARLQIPCGGVHVRNPREIANMNIKLNRQKDQTEFVMETRAAAELIGGVLSIRR
ncbi:hypothetical protein [Bradyrhizobium sp. BWA-3-5]|uniref:hypothetical protein n=1 Tax=Bradyrhizobium sp. BWA-3-5 TaxID=3080013 RepID=UPI00293E8E99|nr:hypothetical protein [Bradyrhizobium sp. BWA-3-5]WOH63872.1 hypothetical protein RX331_24735 [Bradyrhizobium sp. BWA-3-5]